MTALGSSIYDLCCTLSNSLLLEQRTLISRHVASLRDSMKLAMPSAQSHGTIHNNLSFFLPFYAHFRKRTANKKRTGHIVEARHKLHQEARAKLNCMSLHSIFLVQYIITTEVQRKMCVFFFFISVFLIIQLTTGTKCIDYGPSDVKRPENKFNVAE